MNGRKWGVCMAVVGSLLVAGPALAQERGQPYEQPRDYAFAQAPCDDQQGLRLDEQLVVRRHALGVPASFRFCPRAGGRGHVRYSSRLEELRSSESHSLRGIGVVTGGLVAGLGVGLANDNPAAGMLTGAGIGLFTASVLRAVGGW